MDIIIVGSAGSGKSTLANELAEKFNLTYIELDRFKHGKNWQSISKDDMRSAVMAEIVKGEWVIDGNYLSTFGRELMDRADIVIWLDYPFPFVFQRLLRRTVKRSITKEELWNGNRESLYNNLFTRDSVLQHMMHVWKRQRKFYIELFNETNRDKSKKMIRIRHPRELKEALRF